MSSPERRGRAAWFRTGSTRGDSKSPTAPPRAASSAFPTDGPLVLVVGHLITRKDPGLALEAFRRGAPPEARLAFVGRGPLEEELAAAVASAGLVDRVRFVGEVPPEALADWYGACDLLVLTSTREGRPNVVLEALASGRPVLATEAGGTAELLKAFPESLVRSRDPQELAERLSSLLSSPPAADRLRAAALPLSWDASLDALEACLDAARRTTTNTP